MLKVLFVFCFAGYLYANGEHWGYDDKDGPDKWGGQCLGKLQSPINIDKHKDNVKTAQFPRPLIFKNCNVKPECAEMVNNGHSIAITMKMEDPRKTCMISDGPLNGEYICNQFHFHWGRNNLEGSENTINNKSYPLEFHLVCYKNEYESFNNALNCSDGLAVISYLFISKYDRNRNYDPLIKALPYLKEANSKILLNNMPSPNDLTANDCCKYFTYLGSLTTPPCSEGVRWFEFECTIPIGHDQIQAFREIISHNFRPTQPTGQRLIQEVLHQCHNPGIVSQLIQKLLTIPPLNQLFVYN